MPQNISLINPAAAAPPSSTIDAAKILPELPSIVSEPPPAPPAVKPAEVDVPVFRRKQTFATLPAVPDRPNQLGALPTGGNPLPGSPSLSSLPVAGGPKSTLPTRRPEVPNSSAPKSTTPLFRAPVIGKLDDKADDEGNDLVVAEGCFERQLRGAAPANKTRSKKKRRRASAGRLWS